MAGDEGLANTIAWCKADDETLANAIKYRFSDLNVLLQEAQSRNMEIFITQQSGVGDGIALCERFSLGTGLNVSITKTTKF